MIAKLFEVDGRQVLFLRTTGGENDEEQIVVYAEPKEGSAAREFRTSFGFGENSDHADRSFSKASMEFAKAIIKQCDDLLSEDEETI